MSIYKTDIDYDFLRSCTEDELKSYVKENFISPRFDTVNFDKRYSIMKIILEKMLKIQLNREQKVFLYADCERLLNEACAGSGKTTVSQAKLVDIKIAHKIPGKEILSLAYNDHAAKDMLRKHEHIMNCYNSNVPTERRLDKYLSCYTFHAWCRQWVLEYPTEVGLTVPVNRNFIMSDDDVYTLMEVSIKTFVNKNPDCGFQITDTLKSAIVGMYGYIRSTLSLNDVETWKVSTHYKVISTIDPEHIRKIFSMYEIAKRLKKRKDFADLIDGMYTIMCKPENLARIRSNYRVMLVDEYQDITPNMLRVIQLFTEGDPVLGLPPYNECRLICIGDGDQSIYGFQGSDSDNCIRFRQTYTRPEVMTKITSLSENRRCPSTIIDLARDVITSNDKRIDKPILSIRNGGEIETYKYRDLNDQMDYLIGKLKAMNSMELYDTCICYRVLQSSYFLTLKLTEAGIPFRFGSGYMPLTDRLSATLFEVLDLLSYPDEVNYMKKTLYKLLPKSSKFNKDFINNMIEEEVAYRKSGNLYRKFWELNFPDDVQSIAGFQSALSTLQQACILHRKQQPMLKYMPQVIDVAKRYYLNWQLRMGNNNLPEEYLAYITKWFSRNIVFEDFEKQRKDLREEIEFNQSRGVYLTTIHGLKGLEFEKVFMIDMQDDIFPGADITVSKQVNTRQKEALEAEARRLFYVAITRSKNKLTVLFDKERPSRYIRFFEKDNELAEKYSAAMKTSNFTEEDGFLVNDTDIQAYVGDHLKQDGEFMIADNYDSPMLEDLEEDIIDPLEIISDRDSSEDSLDLLDPFEGLVDTSVVETIPTIYEDTQTPIRLTDAVNGLSMFKDLLLAEKEKEDKLIKTLGEQNYETIQSKPKVRSIIDMIMGNEEN